MSLDKGMLDQGLQVALCDSPRQKFKSSYWRPISQGAYTSIFGVTLSYARGRKEKLVAKVYHGEPKVDEPFHHGANRPDIRFMREVRNLGNLRQTVDSRFVPEIYGSDQNVRLVAMEYLGKRTLKNRFLKKASGLKYDALASNNLPSPLLTIYSKVVDILALFIGDCNSRAEQFSGVQAYREQAELEQKGWPKCTQERVARLFSQVSGDQSLEGVLLNLEARMGDLSLCAAPFYDSLEYSHGDFNLLHRIGGKIVDWERFGRYGEGKDFASLAIIVGAEINDSAVILRIPQFSALVDRYLSVVDAVIRRRGNQANVSLDQVSDSLKEVLHSEKGASEYVSGIMTPERKADFIVNVYYHALNELFRVGAAYDRKATVEREEEQGLSEDYSAILRGVRVGLGTLFSQLAANQSLLEQGSKGGRKAEFFSGMKTLLDDMGLPIYKT